MFFEERKQKEIEYYDKEAASSSHSRKESGSLKEFDPFFLESYQFLKNSLKIGYKDKKALDYGCGSGIHLLWLSRVFRNVTGIDLSKNSLAKAKKALVKEKAEGMVNLVLGDCEKMEFPNKSFDVVFDGGTFSSLDLENALKEIHRVLKPFGLLVGIETLGHNPITNLKRKINKILGKRTSWAAGHIFKIQDLDKVKKYFNIVQLKFFHLFSWIAIPCLNLPGGKIFLKVLEKLDYFLITIFPFLKKYSFKIVFVLKKK